MTADQILARARQDDTAGLTADTSAVAHAVDEFVGTGDVASALELVGRLWRIWTSSGHLAEGGEAARKALDANGMAGGVWRARALYGDGVIAFRAGDRERSRQRNEELLELARATNDVRGECDALTGLARLALRDGDFAEVVSLAREGRAKAAACDDAAAEAAPLHLEAAGTRLQQRYDDAAALYRQSLDLNSRLGNPAMVAAEEHNLGWVELHRGDVDAAEEWFRRRDAAAVPDAYGDAWSALNWAAVAAVRGDWDEARRRFDTGREALDNLGVALDPDDRFEFDWLAGQLQC